MADVVKALVLAWSAALLTASYLGIFPQMKMDNTFVASLLTGTAATYTPALGKLNKKKKEENGVIVDNKDSKVGIK